MSDCGQETNVFHQQIDKYLMTVENISENVI